MECLAELHPRYPVIGGVHGQKVGPSRAYRILKLMGDEERLLLVLASKESELLLDSPEPVVGIQRILNL